MQHPSAGFTLVEAMVAITVVAVVATLGLPAFVATLGAARASTTLHLLSADLAMARGTAVMRHANVVACPADATGGPGCGGMDWSSGWRVFVDADGDLQPDADGLLRTTTPPAPDRMRLVANRSHLRYLKDGRSPHSNQTIVACSDDRLLARLVVNNLGRVRTVREDGAAPCPVP